jgi:hypothetical protein
MSRTKPDEPTTALAPIPTVNQTLATRAGADATDTRGKEHIDKGDMILPSLRLVQRTSPEIDPDADRYIEGAKFTDMINSLTRENYGNGPITVLPLGLRKRAIEFGDGGVVIDRNVPIDVDDEGNFLDSRLTFVDDQKPTATLFYEFPCLIVGGGRQDLAVLSMKGTQIRAGKELATIINYRKGPSWEGAYTVTSVRKDFPKGPAAQFVVRPAGPAMAEDAAEAERYYQMMQTRTVVVDEPTDRDDAIDADL